MGINYREIKIQKPDKANKQEQQALDHIIDDMQGKDFQIKNKKEVVLIKLKAINLGKLKNIIKGYDLSADSFLNTIINKIEDIKSYGISNNKRIYVDYNKERKVKNRKAKEAERQKHYYTQNNNFSKENNKLSDRFANRIICADSEEFLKKLPDNCIDLVFTSPPYNFGLDYTDHKDHNYWQNYFDKLFAILKECIRVLKYSGRIIINVQPLFSDYIPSHHIISNFFMDNKLIWKGEILWEKNNYNCKYTAWGSWKSPSSPYLKYTWEFLEIFTKGTMKKAGDKDKIDIQAEEFKEWVTAKWSISPEKNMDEYEHPAMFPEELARRVLKLFSYQEDLILDPFNGVGTTSFVAQKHKRKYLGIDISEEYCEMARDRLKKGVEVDDSKRNN